eukprot:819907-Lingulodinium_polyedra.AAC.1
MFEGAIDIAPEATSRSDPTDGHDQDADQREVQQPEARAPQPEEFDITDQLPTIHEDDAENDPDTDD